MPSESKKIWLPSSEMSVRVQDGQITIWEDMKMKEQTLKAPMGFPKEKRDAVDDSET